MESEEFSQVERRRRRQWQPTPVLLPGKSHGGLQSMGSLRGGHDWSDAAAAKRRKSSLEGMNGTVQSPDARRDPLGSCKSCWAKWLAGDFTTYVVKLRTSFNLSFTFFICKIVIKWYWIHRITKRLKWFSSNAWHIVFWKSKLSLLNF